MNERHFNELVLALAREALDVCSPCLRPEEWRDALAEFHERFRKRLLQYEIERQRMIRRGVLREDEREQQPDDPR
jgi:hypothetical protein